MKKLQKPRVQSKVDSPKKSPRSPVAPVPESPSLKAQAVQQERTSCTDEPALDKGLKIGSTKPLPDLPTRVASEDVSTAGDVKEGNPRIKGAIIPAPSKDKSNASSGSPRRSSPIDSLGLLLSGLHLETANSEVPATNPECSIEKILPPVASSELKKSVSPTTSLATNEKISRLSNGTPIRPTTDHMSYYAEFQNTSPLAQRAPPTDDSIFLFDSEMHMLTSPAAASVMTDHKDSQYNFFAMPSIKENAPITYPHGYNALRQQMQVEPASFQFPNFAPSNTTPANKRMSLLSQQLSSQSYGNGIANTSVINQPTFPQSAGQAVRSPMHHFMNNSLNTSGQDQFFGINFEEDLEEQLQLLSPTPEISSPATEFPFDPSQPSNQPIGTPFSKSHGRGASFSNSARPPHHSYRSPSHGGGGDTICSPGSSFFDDVPKYFASHQQQAVLNIMNYKAAHPGSAIPASYITSELAEVQEGRGWCLIGNCGVDRANQRLNAHYDPSKDTTRKRLDHLYDHIRDKHFNCRPFRCSVKPCTQTFSREHDLKRHEKTHMAVSLPCDVCGRHYTREDNLKRHVQLKHSSLPQTSRGAFSSTGFLY